MQEPLECTTPGNSNIYGYGIFIGLYLHWLALILLRYSGESASKITRTRMSANTICYGVTLVTVVTTVRGDALSTDYLFAYYLTVVIFLQESCNLSLARRDGDDDVYLRPDLPVLFHNFLSIFQSGFGVWFWTTGIDRTRQPICGAKGSVYFVFDLDRPSWKYSATLAAVAACLLFGYVFCVHAIELLNRWNTVTPQKYIPLERFVDEIQPWPRIYYGISSSIKQWVQKSWLIRGLLWTMWAIATGFAPTVAALSIGHMLKENHLETDGSMISSGNLIPLLMGITSLVDAVVDAIQTFRRNLRNKRRDEKYDYREAKEVTVTYSLNGMSEEDIRRLLLSSLGVSRLFKETTGREYKVTEGWDASGRSETSKEDVRDLLIYHGKQAEAEAFCEAARNGDVEEVLKFLANGDIDVNVHRIHGVRIEKTPLMLAAGNGHVDVVEALLAHPKIDVARETDSYSTALSYAIKGGHRDVVELLLAVEDYHPLPEAARTGTREVVRALIERNDIDLNWSGNSGATPLWWAAFNGHTNIVELLLDSGRCDLDCPSGSGETPLQAAGRAGHVDTVQFIASRMGGSEASRVTSMFTLIEDVEQHTVQRSWSRTTYS